jgi:pimeloyl-ACP methyl ester carboxylesterase
MGKVLPTKQFISVNDTRLHYLEWGLPDSIPLICLHGHTGHANIWDEFAEAMSDQYRVLAIDQRGHGDSDWAKTGYSRDRFVEDLESFVDLLKLDSFVLVGLSMGGWHSLLYTTKHPDRVKRIVMVDIAPEPSEIAIAQMSIRPSTPMTFETFDDAVTWMRKGNPFASDESLCKDAKHKLQNREDGAWTWKADHSLFNIQLPDMNDQTLIDRYWDAFETINCPILEVRGLESQLVSDKVIDKMKKKGKQFTSIDIPKAGHIVTVDKPLEFIEATRKFLGAF